MGNQKFQNHHQFYTHHQKNTFFPMLCSRPTIKDVNLPRCRGNPSSTSNDPLSPKIGCMGQVKRNNKISGFPTSQCKLISFTNNKSSSTISPVVKYSKLKKLFSGKNLINTPSTTTSTTITKQRGIINVTKKHQRCVRNENVVVDIKIDELDPPLPVIKRVPKLDEGSKNDSLWKRRSGSSLTSLQVQQIQIQPSNICLQPTTV
ncbi:uncharacterized protein [Cicer arietinum]|uniref:Uncharacterized protein LOC101488620 n=1 Tax=Cicer arietinum TaxID=3827 RepID=A0A1S2Z5Y4_CICAR|nr:uncharacterized protein LOC101488620 [Cicer arietinum]